MEIEDRAGLGLGLEINKIYHPTLSTLGYQRHYRYAPPLFSPLALSLFLLKCEVKKVLLSRELVTPDRSVMVMVMVTYHVQTLEC